MKIGIAFDLKSDFEGRVGGPDDRLEEYDSTVTVDAIADALAQLGHTPSRMKSGRAFVERVLSDPPDLVFNIAEGFGSRSREAQVPAVCEMLSIPVTHSDPLTLALTLDKAMAKRLVAASGIRTPRFAVVDSLAQASDLPLTFPCIAKPLFEGSSMGIHKHSRVNDVETLTAEVERLLTNYEQPVIIEEFCTGAEFTVGVLGTGDGARTIAAMEIVPKDGRREDFVYSLEVKRNWQTEVEYHVPPRQSPKVVHAVEELAIASHRALGCRDVSRVDVRLAADGEPCFIEVNPLPGINPVNGDIVILAGRSGVGYRELISRIVEGARARYGI